MHTYSSIGRENTLLKIEVESLTSQNAELKIEVESLRQQVARLEGTESVTDTFSNKIKSSQSDKHVTETRNRTQKK